MFPGSNLLDDAFEAIDSIEIQYLKWGSRTKNGVGQWASIFEAAKPVEASVQAVSRDKYVQLGLDLQKEYYNVFASLEATDINRDQAGDRFVFPNGRTYQVESSNDWFGIDGGWQGGTGWVGPILCVRVPNK